MPRNESPGRDPGADVHRRSAVVVGEPTLDRGIDTALTRATRTAKHSFEVAADDLEHELKEVIGSHRERGRPVGFPAHR